MSEILALARAHVTASECEFKGVLFLPFIYITINPLDVQQMATMSLENHTQPHTHTLAGTSTHRVCIADETQYNL